jgi:phage baseplate assembly protein gpV
MRLQADHRFAGVMARISGVAVGIVSDPNDPAGQGRVRLPSMSELAEAWAPAVKSAVERDRDSGYREGDQVLVAFEQGDTRKPYVIGLLWSHKDAPPAQR